MNEGQVVPASAEQREEALRRALNDFLWLGNNLHNIKSDWFRTLFEAALEDAKNALAL